MFEMMRRLQEFVYRRPLQSLLAGGAVVLAVALLSCAALVVVGTALSAVWVHREAPTAQVAASPTSRSAEALSPLPTPQPSTPTPDAGQALPAMVSPLPTPIDAATAMGDTGDAAGPSQPALLLSPAPTLAPVDVPAPDVALELTPTSQLTLPTVIWIENVGQFPADVRYQVRSSAGGGLWLAADALWMTLIGPAGDELSLLPEPTAVAVAGAADVAGAAAVPQADAMPRQGIRLRFSFEGANPDPELVPLNALHTPVSYLTGPDAAGWRPEVPVWSGVRYENLYPNIDLELTAEEGRYVHRLVLHPGADPAGVRLRVEGAAGLSLEGAGQPGEAGALHITTALGQVVWPLFEVVAADGSRPELPATLLPQLDAGGQVVVAPFYQPPGGQKDEARALALGAPAERAALDDGGLLGQGGNDGSYDVAVDAARNVYVTGYTYRPAALGPPGAFQVVGPAGGSLDAFVLKMGTGGRGLVYAAFWGGSGDEAGRAVAVDGQGSAYVAGTTRSPDLPLTTGSPDGVYGGGDDAFAFKLDAAGTGLAYATYLGGSGDDRGQDLAVDQAGSLYLAGDTSSPDLPLTAGAMDTSLGGQDAFVAKLDAAGTGLAYATLLGGGGLDGATAIAVDAAGQAAVTGLTRSADWPATAGAFDAQLDGPEDAFVARLNAWGTGLVYGTLLGGGGADYGQDVALDAAGQAYVAGATRSADFPTTAWAFDRQYDGGWDGFVARLTPLGDALAYAAFVGGSEDDWGQGISVDGQGYAYLVGSSQAFPPGGDTTAHSAEGASVAGAEGSSAGPPSGEGGYDVFVARIDEFGAGLTYASALGSGGEDYAAAIAVDALGSVYLVGLTRPPQGDLTAGGVTAARSPYDGFVSRLAVGTPFLDLPVRYSNFALAALGNVGDRGLGRVNSWFDHAYPTHTRNRRLTRWDGTVIGFDASSPPRIGESWYDGHGGTDFCWETLGEAILAAAPGTVIDTVSNCRVGNLACGGGFGNRVWIDHGNGYATVYAHLKTVQVTPGTVISDPAGQPLGIMGNTGRSLGTHLHFGVYFDGNGDGRWTREEVVDPYGWAGTGDDPWQGSSYYLWKNALSTRALLGSAEGQSVPAEGWQMLSPSGLVTVTIPADALTSTVVLELGDKPPAAAPRAGWRSTGHSFSLVEAGGRDGAAAGPLVFARPVTVTMAGRLGALPHLDAGQLSLRRWDEANKTWRALPGEVDAEQGRITAQTSQLGRFDLHAPLLCPADVQEPDDHYGAAQAILADGSRIVRLFDIARDVDWFLFEARAGSLYRAEIRGLVAGVKPSLKLYDSDTIAPLGAATPAGSTGERQLLWRAPVDGTYLLQASQLSGSSHGCEAGYELTVLEVQAPKSVALAGPDSGRLQASYAFTATVGSPAATLPLSYTWQVAGRPALGAGQTLAHLGTLTDSLSLSWSSPGTYRLVVTATNAAGSASGAHTIVVEPPVEADFAASPTNGPAPLEVHFTNASKGDYGEILWDLGDGNTSRKENPTHTYELPGVYTVSLTVSGPGGRDTQTRKQYIRVAEPSPAPPALEHRLYVPLILR